MPKQNPYKNPEIKNRNNAEEVAEERSVEHSFDIDEILNKIHSAGKEQSSEKELNAELKLIDEAINQIDKASGSKKSNNSKGKTL